MGVVPLLIFFNEASVNTFLDPALDFFNLFLWSGIGTTPHSRLFKFWFQFEVHLDQFFTRERKMSLISALDILMKSCRF